MNKNYKEAKKELRAIAALAGVSLEEASSMRKHIEKIRKEFGFSSAQQMQAVVESMNLRTMDEFLLAMQRYRAFHQGRNLLTAYYATRWWNNVLSFFGGKKLSPLFDARELLI